MARLLIVESNHEGNNADRHATACWCERLNVFSLSAGGRGWRDDRFVEYGLDVEDEEWVQDINHGQNRLPPGRLEQLLWALEVANATATDRALTAAGKSPPLPPPPPPPPPSTACAMPLYLNKSPPFCLWALEVASAASNVGTSFADGNPSHACLQPSLALLCVAPGVGATCAEGGQRRTAAGGYWATTPPQPPSSQSSLYLPQHDNQLPGRVYCRSWIQLMLQRPRSALIAASDYPLVTALLH